MIQLWLNSTHCYFLLTQLGLNSNPKFAKLTQLWLNSLKSELSQIWLATHHILPNFTKSCRPGEGVRSNAAIGWFTPCNATKKCKIITFLFIKISVSSLTQAVFRWLNSDSNDDQRDSTLTRPISLIFTADSQTHLSQNRVQFDPWLMSRAQPWLYPPLFFRYYRHMLLTNLISIDPQ